MGLSEVHYSLPSDKANNGIKIRKNSQKSLEDLNEKQRTDYHDITGDFLQSTLLYVEYNANKMLKLLNTNLNVKSINNNKKVYSDNIIILYLLLTFFIHFICYEGEAR